MRGLGRVLVWGFAVLVVVYGVDLLQVSARGAGGFGTVTVRHLQEAPLKGSRVEIYNDGSSEERCSRTLFPQEGVAACWWLARHAEVQD